MSNSTPPFPDTDGPAVELVGVPVAPAVSSVATELRRRRELLGWSQAEAARRSGVSRTVVCEIEAGKRVPQTRTYEQLRATLGLALPAAQALLRRPEPRSWSERQLATLAACVLANRGGSLTALAEATGVAIPAVREQLSLLGDRFAAVGLAAIEDGDEVRLAPQSWAADQVARVTTLEVQQALTDEAVEVLVICGFLGAPTRREIEDRRGGVDCEGLLNRMCRRGLLEKVVDDATKGDPNVYRLTALALGTMGHTTLESFQAWCSSELAENRSL